MKHLYCRFNCDFCVSLSGLVGSAYYLVAFQPDSAVAALQRATNTTVTMGKFINLLLLLLLLNDDNVQVLGLR